MSTSDEADSDDNSDLSFFELAGTLGGFGMGLYPSEVNPYRHGARERSGDE